MHARPPGESVFATLEPHLARVQKPIQYVGGELNSVSKPWAETEVRWALMYPDAYEVGLPNQGVQILYEVLNEREGVLAERTYSVWPDMESVMREHGIPQFTVDGHRPVRGFDVFGFSFSTELGYTNMLTALDLAGIPLHAVDRTEDDPVVLAGGHAAFNPEPVADFVDAVVLGDGEEIVLAITEVFREWKAEGRPGGRDGVLMRLAASGGVYVPKFYDVAYDDDRGALLGVLPNRPGVPDRVRKHTLMDLDAWPYPRNPLVPLAETVHERFSVEIFRGCTRGCRFCQAGMITRPVRERSITTIARHGRERHPQVGLRGGRPAVALERRPLRDRRGREGSGRPLRGHERLALAAQHPRRRVQHHPGQRVLAQRPSLGADLRPRGWVGADAQGDQQDGHRGGPDPHGRGGVLPRLAAGEALLHVRPAHRDRRGRARDRGPGQEGDRQGSRGRRPQRHPLHGLHRRVRPQAAHPVPVGLAARRRDHRRAAAQAARGGARRTGSSAAPSASATTTASPASSKDCCPAATAA